jgi:hypothetical protein
MFRKTVAGSCGEGCYPVCDFCKSYDFNGDEQGRYMDNGFCNLHNEKKDPSDGCQDFVCGIDMVG